MSSSARTGKFQSCAQETATSLFWGNDGKTHLFDVFVDYHLITTRCDDESYKALLRSWGYGTERKQDRNSVGTGGGFHDKEIQERT